MLKIKNGFSKAQVHLRKAALPGQQLGQGGHSSYPLKKKKKGQFS